MLISVRFWRFGVNNLTQRDNIMLLVAQHYNGSRVGLSYLSLCIITFIWDRASLTPIYHVTLLCHFMLLPVPCLAIFKNSFTVVLNPMGAGIFLPCSFLYSSAWKKGWHELHSCNQSFRSLYLLFISGSSQHPFLQTQSFPPRGSNPLYFLTFVWNIQSGFVLTGPRQQVMRPPLSIWNKEQSWRLPWWHSG